MGRWLSFLEKAGLVELSAGDRTRAEAARASQAAEVDIEALLASSSEAVAEVEAGEPAPLPSAPPPPLPAVDGSSTIVEGRPLEEIYAESNISGSPFSAEKLLRVLDGLAAMEPAIRIAAIIAMDAADEAWTLGDPLLDANRKSKVLEQQVTRLDHHYAALRDQAEADLAAQDEYRDNATQTIRTQIAELEEMLQAELDTVSVEKARISSELEAARQAASREAARYRTEIERLSVLPQTFQDVTTSKE